MCTGSDYGGGSRCSNRGCEEMQIADEGVGWEIEKVGETGLRTVTEGSEWVRGWDEETESGGGGAKKTTMESLSDRYGMRLVWQAKGKDRQGWNSVDMCKIQANGKEVVVAEGVLIAMLDVGSGRNPLGGGRMNGLQRKRKRYLHGRSGRKAHIGTLSARVHSPRM